MNLVEKIINDVVSNLDRKNLFKFRSMYHEFNIHFTLGLYIRNKYLWNNMEHIESLKEYYKVDSVDSISACIANDILKEVDKLCN